MVYQLLSLNTPNSVDALRYEASTELVVNYQPKYNLTMNIALKMFNLVPGYTAADVKKSYRRLSMLYHPVS